MYKFFKNHPRKKVLRNVNASNTENIVQKNLRTWGPGSAFLEHLKAQILKIYPGVANHDGPFVGLVYVLVCLNDSRYATG